VSEFEFRREVLNRAKHAELLARQALTEFLGQEPDLDDEDNQQELIALERALTEACEARAAAVAALQEVAYRQGYALHKVASTTTTASIF
jgi:hypothetical protein